MPAQPVAQPTREPTARPRPEPPAQPTKPPAGAAGGSAKRAAPRSGRGGGTAGIAGKLAVRADESPWTPEELAAVRGELESEALRLREEIAVAESDLADLLRDAGDGAGDDQADAGSKAFERDHELSLANNARDLLLQNERAAERIDNGTYGICESCGNPIGKERLKAFPRATLCVSCKQRQERR